MIELANVSHTYALGMPFEYSAIENVSMTINTGDFVAIIGSTGSGKTTLIQHFNGLLKPTNGRVLVDGVDINASKLTTREIRRKIGMVFQYPEHQLFDETVAQDIMFGPKNLGLSEPECLERCKESLELVGLPYDTYADRSPFELSGGQMRRVALAGVLSMRPETLILDEPAAGMDPVGRRDLFTLLKKLNQRGSTITIVSHSMEDVASVANSVFVISKGRVAMNGKPADIFSRVSELRAIGLDAPEPAILREKLAARGVHIIGDTISREAIRDAIVRLYKTKGVTA